MPNDAELLLAYARRGEVNSLAALIGRNSAWIAAYLRSHLSPNEVEDALQEVWVRVIRSAAKFRGGSLRAWLMKAAHSVAVDCLRRRGRLKLILDADDESDPEGTSAIDELVDDSPIPSDALELKASREEIREAVANLPLGPREVLLRRIEAEFTFQEIADELGKPLGTVLTWMRTATNILKEQLGVDHEM